MQALWKPRQPQYRRHPDRRLAASSCRRPDLGLSTQRRRQRPALPRAAVPSSTGLVPVAAALVRLALRVSGPASFLLERGGPCILRGPSQPAVRAVPLAAQALLRARDPASLPGQASVVPAPAALPACSRARVRPRAARGRQHAPVNGVAGSATRRAKKAR